MDEFWPRPDQQDPEPSQPAGHPTEPIVPVGGSEEPPPSGLQVETPPSPTVDAAVSPAAVTDRDWQSRFEAQQKRTRIFMGTTAAAVAALLGSLFFAVAQGSSTGPGTLSPTGSGPGMQGQGQFAPPGLDDHDGDGFGRGGPGDDDDRGFERFDH